MPPKGTTSPQNTAPHIPPPLNNEPPGPSSAAPSAPPITALLPSTPLDHDTDVANAMALVPTPTGMEGPDQEADMVAVLEASMPDLSFMLSDTLVLKGAPLQEPGWSTLP